MTFTRQVAGNTNDPTRPDWLRPEVVAIRPDLDLIHRLMAGTTEMWKHADLYIRKWADEQQKLYDVRKTIETVYGALERVTSASVGMLFARAPQLEWGVHEAKLKPHWDNLDGWGTAGHVVAKRFSEHALLDGLGFIVIDHPPAPRPARKGPVTELDEGGFFRPKWAIYGRRQLVSWRSATIDNEERLTQVVFEEQAQEQVAAYGTMAVTQYRRIVLGPNGAMWQVLREEKDAQVGAFRVVGEGVYRNKAGQTRNTLPVRVAYTGRTDGILTAKPPLLPIAYANLAHWQKASNLSFYEDFCAFPQPVLVGTLAADPVTGKPGAIAVGPGVAVHATAGSTYEIIELSGTSMEQLRKGLDEKLYRIASTALSFLLPETRAAETAEAKRLDATAENSTLATAAQGIEDALNGALEDHGWYLGIPKAEVPVITISRDYESTALGADVMRAYAELKKTGFPVRPIIEALVAGGRIPADADIEMLELQWLAGEIAKERETEVQDAA